MVVVVVKVFVLACLYILVSACAVVGVRLGKINIAINNIGKKRCSNLLPLRRLKPSNIIMVNSPQGPVLPPLPVTAVSRRSVLGFTPYLSGVLSTASNTPSLSVSLKPSIRPSLSLSNAAYLVPAISFTPSLSLSTSL